MSTHNMSTLTGEYTYSMIISAPQVSKEHKTFIPFKDLQSVF